jgi:ubiquinone/menaquinone biosynthesis C-methylase UbiE
MSDPAHNPPTDPPPDGARSFGSVVNAYDRGRPSYPREAARWLVGDRPATVLELGAGTGKLTAELVALGHDVQATDPDEAMLAVLRRDLPDVRVSVGAAEEIPAPDRSVDVVVCAQAFHWFDPDRALPEIARVLRPGGRLSLVWNQRDERIPWVRRLGGLIGSQDQLREPAEPIVRSALFGFVEDAAFRFWQTVDRESIQDLVLSRSNIAVLDEEARAAKLAEVLAFYDDYGRGMDGMQLPYEARCFRAKVLDQGGAEPEPPPATEEVPAPPAETPEVSDGTDTDMLLIDFR